MTDRSCLICRGNQYTKYLDRSRPRACDMGFFLLVSFPSVLIYLKLDFDLSDKNKIMA